jgi:voltage-gated potassium channel Kch
VFDEILLGILHTSVTVLIHGLATVALASRLRHGHTLGGDGPFWRDFLGVVFVVSVVFVVTVLEAAWWAANYTWLGAIAAFDEAMYFSMVTYTTLGYGDITLQEGWRLLSGFQAANGVIIAGWSTALVIAVVQRVYNARQPGG